MISYQNFSLNTLMDIKLHAGFKPAISVLRKQNERKESVLYGFKPSTSWSYLARHLQKASTFSLLIRMYIHIQIHTHVYTHPHMMEVYNFIPLPCHSSDMKHLMLQVMSLSGSY